MPRHHRDTTHFHTKVSIMLRLSKERYDTLWNLLEPRTFQHLHCVNCGHKFDDKEKYYHLRFFPTNYALCEKCKSIAKLFVDFDPKGSREPERRSWGWMRRLCFLRDDYRCRLCGKPAHEAHHIIPRKDGGTHNLRNLISLCEKCHKDTYRQGYGGIEVPAKWIAEGIQKVL